MNDRENGDWLLRFNTNQTEYVLVVRYANHSVDRLMSRWVNEYNICQVCDLYKRKKVF